MSQQPQRRGLCNRRPANQNVANTRISTDFPSGPMLGIICHSATQRLAMASLLDCQICTRLSHQPSPGSPMIYYAGTSSWLSILVIELTSPIPISSPSSLETFLIPTLNTFTGVSALFVLSPQCRPVENMTPSVQPKDILITLPHGTFSPTFLPVFTRALSTLRTRRSPLVALAIQRNVARLQLSHPLDSPLRLPPSTSTNTANQPQPSTCGCLPLPRTNAASAAAAATTTTTPAPHPPSIYYTPTPDAQSYANLRVPVVGVYAVGEERSGGRGKAGRKAAEAAEGYRCMLAAGWVVEVLRELRAELQMD